MSTVYVCMDRDMECGNREANWCASCPKRRTAPSSPMGEELPKWIDDHKGADPFMDDVIAYIESMQRQYAERIRQLERELATQSPPQSIGDDPKFRKLLADLVRRAGYNISGKASPAALIAYIDGRTAGTAPDVGEEK